MTNKNSYDKFLAVDKKRLKDAEVMLECSVSLDSNEVVSKILAVNVEGNCTQVEALTGEANANGNIVVSLVYLTEQGLVGNSVYSSPFSTKFTDALINAKSKVFGKVANIDAKVQSLNNNTAKVDCLIRLKGFCYNNEEIPYLSEVSSDVCTLEEQSQFETLSGSLNSSWIENMEIELKEPVRKVLSSSCDVYVKDVTSADSFVSIVCEITNKLMYLTDEETPKIKTVYSKTDVKQEVECEFATKQSKAEVSLNVLKNEVKNSISEKENEIKKVLVALDATDEVVEEAVNINANIIVTHHPMIFGSIKKVNDDTHLGSRIIKLIKNGIGHYAMHTNLDIAFGGVNDELAKILDMKNVKVLSVSCEQEGKENGLGRYGDITPKTLKEFALEIKEKLGLDGIRIIGDEDNIVSKAGLCTGAGIEFMGDAKMSGCDVYITSDIKYHDSQKALEEGISLIDATHYGSENIIVPVIAKYIRENIKDIEVVESKVDGQVFKTLK